MTWVEYGKTWRHFCTFEADNLSVPGRQIEVAKADGLHRFLIGNINELGGGCDDCPEVFKHEVVVRYRDIATAELLDS